MKLSSRLHWPSVLAVVFLFVLALTLFVYKDEAKQVVRQILESSSILAFIWIYVSVAVISKNLFLDGVRSNHFETVTEALFSISGYGIAATTSITLLKGAYLQFFFKALYFYNFNELDLASIFVVSGYLLTYTGIVTTKMLSDVVFRAKGSSTELTDTARTAQGVSQGKQHTNAASGQVISSQPQTQRISITTAQTYTCSHCGFGYYLNNPLGPGAVTVGATTTCPKCGNVENVKNSWRI